MSPAQGWSCWQVHERTLQGDFLMALLKDMVALRRAQNKPLKVRRSDSMNSELMGKLASWSANDSECAAKEWKTLHRPYLQGLSASNLGCSNWSLLYPWLDSCRSGRLFYKLVAQALQYRLTP